MQLGKEFMWPLVAALAIATGSYLGTVELNHPSRVFGDTTAQTARPTAPLQKGAVEPLQELSHAFRSVHDALKDAVVNIHVVEKVAANMNGSMPDGLHLPKGFQLPPEFRNMIPQMPDHMTPMEGTGSGVIVSPDGYIVTNNHVVNGASDISVTLNDGRELPAKVIGTDPKTDLAVVKISADHLTYAKFGDSDAMQVGDWVLAFGSPFGFQQTMTQGIISAKGRQIGIIAEHNPALRGLTYEDFLQTDAAINPGNSGGPLVDLNGEVIGINAAIASNSGAYNGIGFSIPSNDVQYIMNSLITHGKVVRGFLDVQIEDINHPAPRDKALAESIKKSGFAGKGALVEEVAPEGPAGKGGIKSGDVITAIDDKPVDTVDALRNTIARTAPGTKVTLSLFRDGKTVELSFPVGTQPSENPEFAEAPGSSQPSAANEKIGVAVKSLDAATAMKYHLKAGEGVIVTEVRPGSLAANVGIDAGDVITHVNREPVDTPEQFRHAMGKAKVSNGVRISLRTPEGMERMVFVQNQ